MKLNTIAFSFIYRCICMFLHQQDHDKSVKLINKQDHRWQLWAVSTFLLHADSATGWIFPELLFDFNKRTLEGAVLQAEKERELCVNANNGRRERQPSTNIWYILFIHVRENPQRPLDRCKVVHHFYSILSDILSWGKHKLTTFVPMPAYFTITLYFL